MHTCEMPILKPGLYKKGIRQHGEFKGASKDVEPCGEPASAKVRGRWFCEDHFEEVEIAYDIVETQHQIDDLKKD